MVVDRMSASETEYLVRPSAGGELVVLLTWLEQQGADRVRGVGLNAYHQLQLQLPHGFYLLCPPGASLRNGVVIVPRYGTVQIETARRPSGSTSGFLFLRSLLGFAGQRRGRDDEDQSPDGEGPLAKHRAEGQSERGAPAMPTHFLQQRETPSSAGPPSYGAVLSAMTPHELQYGTPSPLGPPPYGAAFSAAHGYPWQASAPWPPSAPPPPLPPPPPPPPFQPLQRPPPTSSVPLSPAPPPQGPYPREQAATVLDLLVLLRDVGGGGWTPVSHVHAAWAALGPTTPAARHRVIRRASELGLVAASETASGERSVILSPYAQDLMR